MNIENFEKYGVEQDRLSFLVNRDGVEGAYKFALQTRNTYRKTFFARDRNGRKLFVHDRVYRRGYIESYLAFKRFCEDYNKSL